MSKIRAASNANHHFAPANVPAQSLVHNAALIQSTKLIIPCDNPLFSTPNHLSAMMPKKKLAETVLILTHFFLLSTFAPSFSLNPDTSLTLLIKQNFTESVRVTDKKKIDVVKEVLTRLQ